MKKTSLFTIATSLLVGAALGYGLTRLTTRTQTDSMGPRETIMSMQAKETTVPLVALDNATIRDAIDYLQVIIPDSSNLKEKTTPKAISFLLIDPENKSKTISMNLKEIRLDYLCERIAQIAGLNVIFDDDAIVFTSQIR